MKKRNFIILIASVYMFSMHGATIGSDSAPVRLTAQQTFMDGDIVAAFGFLEGGFAFDKINSRVQFRSFFPVSGDIEWNGGTLELQQDLILRNNSDIISFGSIDGNNHVFELAKSNTQFPNGNVLGFECQVDLIDEIDVPSNGESVDWSFDSNFLAIGLGSNSCPHEAIQIYKRDVLAFTVTFTELLGNCTEVTSVRWHPSDYFLAVSRLSSSGSELFIIEVDPTTGAAAVRSSDEVGSSVNAIAWTPDGAFLAVGGGSDVAMYTVSAAGIISGAPVETFAIPGGQDVQTQALDFDTTGEYLAVGLNDNGSDPELLILEFDDSGPTLSSNASFATGSDDVRSLAWNKTCTDLVVIGLGGSTGDLVEVLQHDAAGGTVSKIAGIPGLGDLVRSVHWSPDGDNLAIGRDADPGFEFRVYDFNKTTMAITELLGRNYTEAVESVRWSPDGRFIALGSDEDVFGIYLTEDGGNLEFCFTISDLKIILNCDLHILNCCYTFTGNCTINGRGHTLTIDPKVNFVVLSESSLLFTDITIKDLSDNNRILLQDNTSTLSFENVEWIQDGDYTFTQGHFDVIKDFTIIGNGHNFTYQSDAQSTIQECGKMTLDRGVTFSYDPTIASGDLLKLVEDTSQLIVNSATIHSTTTGLRLTKGELIVDGQSQLSSEAMVESEGIRFGDGALASNNLCVRWLAESNLELTSGFLRYDNV